MKKIATILFFAALSPVFGALNFVQLTDPHLFDKPGREADIADSQEAFSSCIATINELHLTNNFKFAVITGDIGIENFNPDCDPSRWKAAVKFVADALKSSKIDTWLFVPGNNDIADENPTNIWIYNRFIEEVRTNLLRNSFQIIDLCPSNPATAGRSLSHDHVVGKYHFLGFNNSCFKGNNESNSPALLHADQMDCINQVSSRLTSDFTYVFYHIPELDDPGPVFDGKLLAKVRTSKGSFGIGNDAYRSWTVSNDVRVAWDVVVTNASVKALIAGHFHSDNTNCYENFSWVTNKDDAAINLNPRKLYIAPPVSTKFQTQSFQARGFRTYSIAANGDITSEIAWYPFRKDPPVGHVAGKSEPNKTDLNIVAELKLTNVPPNLFQSYIIMTSSPVRVDVNCCATHQDCKCRKKKDGGDDGSGNGSPGPGWGWPLVCILIGGAGGRFAIRILGIEKRANELQEKSDKYLNELEAILLEVFGIPKESSQPNEKQLPSILEILLHDLCFSTTRSRASQELRRWVEVQSRNMQIRPSVKFNLVQALNNLDNVVEVLPGKEPSKKLLSFAPNWYDLKDALAGIVAAGLVPVFLRMVSSGLLVESTNDDLSSIASLFGYCFLAGMLGTEFIATVLKMFRWLVAQADKKISEVSLGN